MKNKLLTGSTVGAGLLILVIAGGTLLHLEKDFLFRAQEQSLFLPTSLFYRTLAIYPGGTLSWLGCFLTQFFYHPALGTAILTGLWAALFALGIWVFRVPPRWRALALIAPAALLAAIVQTGYFIFYAKLQGYLFVPTLGMLFSLLAAAGWRLLPPRYGLRPMWMTLWACAGYPLLGAWSFLGTLHMLVLLWQPTGKEDTGDTPSRTARLAITGGGLLLTAAVPLVAYHGYDQTNLSFVYVAALPCFQVGEETFFQFRIPYVVMALAWIPAAFAPKRIPLWSCIAVQTAVAIATVWGVTRVWYRDANFNKELRIAQAMEELDWERVLDIARDGSAGPPTRLIVMNRNLALLRVGRSGDELFHYPEGGQAPNAPFRARLAQVGGKALYLHYGKTNFAYRWCMEDCVEFGWNIENLKVMTKASLLNEDWGVARKYLNLLKRTRYYAEWAKRYEDYIGHPEKVATDPELEPITHFLTYDDQLDGDNTLVELYLLNSFAHGDGNDPLYQEQTLIAALLLKDIQLFWPRFFKYATLHAADKHMPIHYQEAVYLYGTLENQVDISKMPFDPQVPETYKRFKEFNHQCGTMTEEQKAKAFYPLFGNTFFYYYFLVRNIQTN